MITSKGTLTCRRFSPTGQYVGVVTLNIRKSDAMTRMHAAIAAQDDGFTYRDMEQLDSGTLALGKLARLFSPAEIVAAAQKRRSELAAESVELEDLLAVLKDPAFGAAQGGTRALEHGFPRPGDGRTAEKSVDRDGQDHPAHARRTLASMGWKGKANGKGSEVYSHPDKTSAITLHGEGHSLQGFHDHRQANGLSQRSRNRDMRYTAK